MRTVRGKKAIRDRRNSKAMAKKAVSSHRGTASQHPHTMYPLHENGQSRVKAGARAAIETRQPATNAALANRRLWIMRLLMMANALAS